MWPLCKGRPLKVLALSLLLQMVLLTSGGQADLRKAKVGDVMPEFSLPDSTGATFIYKHGGGKVLVLAFLPTGQSRYERAIADIQAVAEKIPEQVNGLGFAGIISGSAGKHLVKPREPGAKLGFPILMDNDYHLWGTLGVIAAPTVLIIGKDDKILWVKAGEGTDFVPRSYGPI